jgi:hypothetical protein
VLIASWGRWLAALSVGTTAAGSSGLVGWEQLMLRGVAGPPVIRSRVREDRSTF